MSTYTKITDSERLEFLFSLNRPANKALLDIELSLINEAPVDMVVVRAAIDTSIMKVRKPPANIRHDFTEDEVWWEIVRKMSAIEDNCLYHMGVASTARHVYENATPEERANYPYPDKGPAKPGNLRRLFDDSLKEQCGYYSTVRVIELPKPSPRSRIKRVILVYDNADDATVTRGTGPFQTLEQAKSCFLNGGR